MRVEEYDSNLKVESSIQRDGLIWFDVRKAPFQLYGLYDAQDASLPFHRLPLDVAEHTNPGVAGLNFHTAGGRVRFSTDSPYIAIRCEMRDPLKNVLMPHMAPSGIQGFDLWKAKENGMEDFYCAFLPPWNLEGDTFEGVRENLPAGVSNYTLNFPLYGTCKNLYIGVKEGSVLTEGRPYRDSAPIVYYGSSITQGGCASRPGSAYENYVSAKYNVDYINFGFSGSSKGEVAMVNHMASLDMSIFVCDYDHNAPTLEHLQATLPNVYQTIRAAHPDIPYIFMSSPGMDLGAPRRDYIRSVYQAAVDAGDQNVYFIDGEKIYEGEFYRACTVDGCHPTDLGFYRMYQALDRVLCDLL